MRKAPLLPVALALMAGIVAARWWLPTPAVWWWAIAACMLTTGICLLAFRNLRHYVLIPSWLLCAALGGLLGALDREADWTHQGAERVHLAVRLNESPQPRERSWRAKATVLSRDGEPCTGDITLFLRKDSTAATLRYGDRLLLYGHPDYDRRYIYVTADHYTTTQRDSTSLRAHSERLRMRLLRRMQSGPLAPRQAGVAEALTLGWRGDLDAGVQASFRDAGIAHLLAVSGLHVGLLAALVGVLLIWVGKERRGRIIRGNVQLGAIWAFALLTGLAPSTVRAALMFSLFIVADAAGRRTPKINLLALAAIITLMAKPALLYDVGWQLSYSAVAGILVSRPFITAFRNRIWQGASVSLAATLTTLPVVATTFHRLPVYFLLANMVIVPLAGVMLALSLAYMALPCSVTAWPLETVVNAAERFTAWVASWPGAVVEI